MGLWLAIATAMLALVVWFTRPTLTVEPQGLDIELSFGQLGPAYVIHIDKSGVSAEEIPFCAAPIMDWPW